MVQVDYSRDALFDSFGLRRLKASYMLPDESSPQDRFAYIATRLGSNDAHAQRVYDYASKHWLSFSTPILSLGRSKHGLPISCYLSCLPDTADGLINTWSEASRLSMLGGGVGIGVKIRPADSKSTGVMAHMSTYNSACLAYKQDDVRRGSYAVYLDINHPEIMQFIDMRKETGDHNIRCPNLHHGVNISDDFMQLLERCIVGGQNVNDDWPLVDPHTKRVQSVISARYLWQQLLETRVQTGEPYICFIDTCNRSMPECQRKLGLTIQQSNLCSEIVLPTNEERTAVCCLSSLNLAKYDEWKDDPLFVRDVCELLDNALQMFIEHAPSTIERAKISATKERSIGIGTTAWHDHIQSKNVAIESDEARRINIEIFSSLRDKIDAAALELGAERGEPDDAKGTGRRFCCAMAIAPNATSSIIMGNTSPSIEPYRANAYQQDTLSGSFLNKNRHLDALLTSKGVNTDDVWMSIIMNNGSVQHLPYLSIHEKNVFKTAFELDQHVLIELAADRQRYIDQSQSLNIFLPPNVSVRTLHDIHMDAWKLGLKTLYYLRSTKKSSADTLLMKPAINEYCTRQEGCTACE